MYVTISSQQTSTVYLSEDETTFFVVPNFPTFHHLEHLSVDLFPNAVSNLHVEGRTTSRFQTICISSRRTKQRANNASVGFWGIPLATPLVDIFRARDWARIPICISSLAFGSSGFWSWNIWK